MRRWCLNVALCVIGVGLFVTADVAHANGVEDLLYEKGQITKEEWLKLKADEEKRSDYSRSGDDQKMVR